MIILLLIGLMCFHIILANLKLPYGSIKPVYAYQDFPAS